MLLNPIKFLPIILPTNLLSSFHRHGPTHVFHTILSHLYTFLVPTILSPLSFLPSCPYSSFPTDLTFILPTDLSSPTPLTWPYPDTSRYPVLLLLTNLFLPLSFLPSSPHLFLPTDMTIHILLPPPLSFPSTWPHPVPFHRPAHTLILPTDLTSTFFLPLP